MFTVPEPASAQQIIATLQRVEDESVAYWSGFEPAAFFAKIDGHWSPAENVRHLIKSIRPVTQALRVPRLVLWFKFGKSHRNSNPWPEIQARYRALLDAGGNAGRFAPAEREEPDPEAGKARIMGQFVQVNRELRAAIAKWKDRSLDRYQLPHPLLGMLTLREMLIFTAYHQIHHLDGVKGRRGEGHTDVD